MISPATFLVLWALLLPGIAWVALKTAPSSTALTLGAAGLFGWSLTEYALHRFVFHWRPRRAALASFVFVLHGNHHAVPSDSLRNLMPPIVSVPLGCVIWAGCLAVFGSAGSWIFLGFMIGYVIYDMTHFACHQRPMKGRLARIFKQNHMRHHYGRGHGNYATTVMFWDRLFGTRVT
jgi:sterol desaturase/sphingolipid hydroxylase (fatty acid hydroxylase superfamily)